MEPKKASISILQKITNFLIGFVLSFFILVISIKIIQSSWQGYIIGVVLSIVCTAIVLMIQKKRMTPGKGGIITLGMAIANLIMILIGVLFFLFLSLSVQQALN